MVWTSVARPARPTKMRSFIWKTLRKSQETVWAWAPRRVSEAMATQFLPLIAIMAAPLYSKIDIVSERRRERRRERSELYSRY